MKKGFIGEKKDDKLSSVIYGTPNTDVKPDKT